jgi:hypothetical protein
VRKIERPLLVRRRDHARRQAAGTQCLRFLRFKHKPSSRYTR